MQDKLSLTCQGIQERLKRFQEDLLAQEEYQAFLSHLEKCAKCKEYVQSIGSLSNQIWELGNVKVPIDLVSTVLFKLAHPAKQEVPAPAFIIPRAAVIGLVIFLLIGTVLVGGFFYGNKIRKAHVTTETPSVVVSSLQIQKAPLGGAGESGSVTSEETTSEAPQETIVNMYITAGEEPTSNTVKPVVVKAKSLHWHLALPDTQSKAATDENSSDIAAELNEKNVQLKKVEETIKSLDQKNQEGLGPYYSDKTKSALSVAAQQRERIMNMNISEKEALVADIARLKSEQTQKDATMRQNIADRKRAVIDQRAHLLNILNAFNIRRDYDANGVVFFTSRGKEAGKVLEQIRLMAGNDSSVDDFTKEPYTLPDESCQVSLYLEQEDPNIHHWHVDPSMPDKKAELVSVISEYSGLMDYQSDGCVVFSVPMAKLDELRRRIRAMGANLDEYGATPSGENVLISKPAVVSIFFMN